MKKVKKSKYCIKSSSHFLLNTRMLKW